MREKQMHRFASIFLVLLILLAPVAASVPACAQKRVALVVGNAAYQYTARLANPTNDADDMTAALRKLGFEVVVVKDVDKRSLEMVLANFGRQAQEADAALVYYAGHGIQFQGLNYLMPVDARLEDEYSINYELTRIDDVLFALSRARGVKILILDACRNNPLAERFSSRGVNRDFAQTRGLARIEAPRGMLVAFATQSDQVAVDGVGRNSPFTGALLKEIQEPGIEIATLFRRVAIDVNRATGGRQLPELSISMAGEFYLNTRETDMQAWAKLHGSSDRRQLSDFITEYPNSPLIRDAQERLAALDRAEKLRLEEEARAQAEREQMLRERSQRNRFETGRIALDEVQQDPGEEGRHRTNTPVISEELHGATEKLPARHSASLPPAEPVSRPSLQPDALSGGALVQGIKRELKRVGCYTGRIDDDWTTSETKSSLNRFAKYGNLSAEPTIPDVEFLDFIRSRPDRVCPLECGAQKIERNGQCVARNKEPGKPLARPAEPKETAPPATRSTALSRADQAWASGTYRQCMGATAGCYERTIRLHTPEWARAWCSRRPTC
jgi:Caspase domain